MKILKQAAEFTFNLVEALPQITLKITIFSFTKMFDLCLTDISSAIQRLVAEIVCVHSV
jgi:hypothetical protein